MKRWRTLIFCVLVGAAAAAQAGSVPAVGNQPTQAPDEAKWEAVEQLLIALELPALVRHEMRHQPSSPADQQEVLQHMSEHVDDHDIIVNFVPVYLRYLNARDAGRLAAHYRSAAGRKRVAAMLAQAGAAGGDSAPVYTDAEAVEIQQADSLPGARALLDNDAALKEQRRYGILNWSTVYKTVLLRQAASDMQAILRAQLRPDGGKTPANAVFKPTGLASLDKKTALSVDNSLRSAALDAALRQDLEAYDFEHVLDAQRMLSKEGLALSRSSLAKTEERMERYLRDRQQNVQRFWEQFKIVVADPSAQAYLEPEMEKALALQVRVAENARATLDIFGRILSFFESRLGSISMRDGVRVFKDDADLQLFLNLSRQLQKAETDNNDALNDHRQLIETALNPSRR